jgi:DNA-binding transcriptional LysR family regulator
MEPNVRLLRYILAVADAGTFTAAAEVLHASQPALSQQIRKLEGELGFTLFQRGTRHVTLTPHGKGPDQPEPGLRRPVPRHRPRRLS